MADGRSLRSRSCEGSSGFAVQTHSSRRGSLLFFIRQAVPALNPAEFSNIARSERDFWWYRGMREILFRLLDPIAKILIAKGTPAPRVLEAGCGTGHLSSMLRERYGWTPVALDLGRDGLEYARGFGLDRLVQGDAAALPFSASSFDVALSMDVIVHFEPGKEQPAFDELARVLGPGGLAVIRVSALDILRSRHSEFAHERQRFTKTRLLECALRAGLTPLRCTYLNSLLLPVALAKFRLWEPFTSAPAASGVEPVAGWLNSVLYTALWMESRWLAAGGAFPLGQSLLFIGRKDPV